MPDDVLPDDLPDPADDEFDRRYPDACTLRTSLRELQRSVARFQRRNAEALGCKSAEYACESSLGLPLTSRIRGQQLLAAVSTLRKVAFPHPPVVRRDRALFSCDSKCGVQVSLRDREITCAPARLDVGAAVSAVATRGEPRAKAARFVEIISAAIGHSSGSKIGLRVSEK